MSTAATSGKRRRQRRFGSTVLVVVLSLALTWLGAPNTASASLFGEENATLVAILTQQIEAVAKAGAQLAQMIDAVTRLKRMVEQGDTLLSKAGSGGLDAVLSELQYTLDSYRAIDRDIKLIGFDLARVDSQREQVYQQSLAGVPDADFSKHAAQWNAEIAESSRVAMRAQTNLSTLEKRNETLQQIQRDSGSTPGVVGQLQLVVRGVGVLHADLEALQRSLDTGMRVTSAVAAAQAASAAMADEDSKRMLKNYTYRGARRAVPNTLP